MDLHSQARLTDAGELQTARLRIAPLTVSHAAEFAAWSGMPEVSRMTGSVLPGWNATQAADWIAERRWHGGPGFVLGVWRKGLPELIGQVGMSKAPTDIGYMIAPAHAGQGYAFEAAGALLSAAFHRFDLDEVIASAFQDNPASMRILDKLGFERLEEKQVQTPTRVEPALIYKYRLSNPDRKPLQ